MLTRRMSYDKHNFAANFHKISIVAFDHGQPTKMSICLAVVRILEENLHRPQFDKFQNTVAIPLRLDEGEFITQVHAVDSLDTGLNGLVKYRLQEESQYFVIDSENGRSTYTIVYFICDCLLIRSKGNRNN